MSALLVLFQRAVEQDDRPVARGLLERWRDVANHLTPLLRRRPEGTPALLAALIESANLAAVAHGALSDAGRPASGATEEFRSAAWTLQGTLNEAKATLIIATKEDA